MWPLLVHWGEDCGRDDWACFPLLMGADKPQKGCLDRSMVSTCAVCNFPLVPGYSKHMEIQAFGLLQFSTIGNPYTHLYHKS